MKVFVTDKKNYRNISIAKRCSNGMTEFLVHDIQLGFLWFWSKRSTLESKESVIFLAGSNQPKIARPCR